VKISEVFTGEARSLLIRAGAIATRLRDEGRLAPADAWMVDELQRRLSALDAAPTGGGGCLTGASAANERIPLYHSWRRWPVP
jgi:hypothetical protein